MRKTLLLTFFALIAFTAGAWAKGELNGVFTINAAGDRILFSKGNLQQVNGTWQFAEHQYDYFGTNQYSDHYDWFAYNGYSAPSDGTSWYILSQAEWAYLFESRTVTNTLSEGALYSKATIGGTYKGVIVFPDNYTHPNGTDFTGNCNNPTEAYSSTVSLEGWALMEAAGCVFLPAAGYSTSPGQVNQAAIYQSTTLPRSGYCNTPGFYIDYMAMKDESKTSTGVAVRYVKKYELTQDANGYYLLGSVQDWKDFAEIVNSETNTAANAKMIADIDLGDDQTYISPTWHGDYSNRHYHGTFDGQGHTLTVHYSSSNAFHTPFSQTSGATIKNLHVAGTLTSTSSDATHMSGLISNSAGNDVIQNVWVSADITSGGSGWIECGAFIGCNNCGSSTITDCLFTGSLKTTSGYYNGCFVGYVHSGSTSTSNCLSTGTFELTGSPNYVAVGTVTNSYVKQHTGTIPSSMQVTDAQLSNGTTTAALQNGRSEEIWVQDPVTYQPVLKLFANDFSYNVPSSGVGSFSSKAKVQLPDGLTAYYCKEYDSTNGIIAAVPLDNNVIPANTGVLIRGEAGAYTLSATNATAATVEDNALVAVTEATHVDATSSQFTNFMLSSGKFIKIAASSDPNVKMPANKAYLQLALGNTSSKEFTLLWDEDPTAIKFESSEVRKSESIYDLQGRKVTNPEKGRLYIINGKVVKY